MCVQALAIVNNDTLIRPCQGNLADWKMIRKSETERKKANQQQCHRKKVCVFWVCGGLKGEVNCVLLCVFLYGHTAINTVSLWKLPGDQWASRIMFYLLIKRRKGRRNKLLNGVWADKVCSWIPIAPQSFQSLTTDLEMPISHLLIGDSRSRPLPHFRNWPSLGKPRDAVYYCWS